ncbi:peptidoglycan D,D-transpeptidase FtsI family protein [Paenibacillus sp. UNC451MF]|uniref:peptidoglycan D,D-transpeptidase FtsI family protein n=1 Tax=Paenibacillus sp. UNC451MF TaxID=1449063 RepID=UPI00048E243C|nr:penicillin-binding transpeptidase domain-containing protein [Paenibacillus sp. UNC451MF]
MANSSQMKKHRLFYTLLLIIAALVVLNGRLFWVQLAASHNLSRHHINLVENSVIQREKGIVLDSGRGDFFDRNGIPLTGKSLSVLTVFPVNHHFPENNKETEAQMQMAQLLNVSLEEWRSFTLALKAPQIWSVDGKPVVLTERQIEQIEALKLPQTAVTQFKQRYDMKPLASQVIGFIGQNPDRITRQFTDQFHSGELQLTSKIGGAGLEKSFEPWLQGVGSTSVSLFTDAKINPLQGLATRVFAPQNGYYPIKVMTTLDAGIQQKVEQIMRKLEVKEGAVVVLDTENADVVAMASQPYFDPDHIDMETGSWSNRALKAVAPGSIFKTVTAAAALEEHAVDLKETFECDGELGKYGLTCWKKDGHGTITLEEGYAQSCNIAFARIAERLDGSKFEEYAHKLGLGVQVGWQGDFLQKKDFQSWDAEEQGQVFSSTTAQQDGGVKAQTSIGQRDVLITPLQAANMVVTLLHKGKVSSPRVVKELRFRNDRSMETLSAKEVDGLNERITPATAELLLSWMQDVVDHGTGKGLKKAQWKLAGKSGTAQVVDKQGNEKVNEWFIGYGPVEKPRYAVAVLVQNAEPDQKNTSIPLFNQVMDVLAEPTQ